MKWIGAWSLVQGLLLIARVNDSGAGNNIARVIAVRLKQRESLDLKNLTAASLIISSFPSVVLAGIAAPLIGWYVIAQFGTELGRDALTVIVWLAFANAVLTAISTILLAICEGAFQLNFKSATIIYGNIAGMACVIPALKYAGPAGIGWTYLAITGTQFVFAATRVLQLSKPDHGITPARVSKSIGLLWRENMHLSGIALIRISFEPVTKFLLSLFAPLATIAVFELALRVATQIRVIIQSALQPLLVVGARPNAGTKESKVPAVFLRNDRALSTLSIGLLIAQLFAAPAIQSLGMGSQDVTFVAFFALLAAGNALNTMGLSGYFWQMSSGILKPLVRVQMFMAIINGTIGALGALVHSELLVVAAYSLAFAFGGWHTRSFLGTPTGGRVFATFILLISAAAVTGALLFLYPMTPDWTILLLSVAIAAGILCLYTALRISRRNAS